MTHMGLLGVLTNPKAFPAGACTIARAWELVNELLSDRRVFFAPDPPNVDAIWESSMRHPGVGPSSWTDTYLAAFAQGHEYEMVTFDRGFRRWRGVEVCVLIPSTESPR